MLLNRETLQGLRDGSITLAFRRWRRPTVKAGGTLLTSVGLLSVDSVDRIDEAKITEQDARAAGFGDLPELRARLSERTEGDVYRVRLSLAGPDPRVALRQEIPAGEALAELVASLERMDRRGRSGPWTLRMLKLLRDRPAERAADLALEFGMEKSSFKAHVRGLKSLGLTESLEVGYRLSPRGVSVLSALEEGPAD
jgi:hypothetical protein